MNDVYFCIILFLRTTRHGRHMPQSNHVMGLSWGTFQQRNEDMTTGLHGGVIFVLFLKCNSSLYVRAIKKF